MFERLLKYTIHPTASIMDALIKINNDKKGFLIVVSTDNKVIGTITDGDIRRAFIEGKTVNDSIENVFSSEFVSLNSDNAISEAIELFKNEGIEFIPVLDDRENLHNIITKKQLHSMLLQDIHADLNYNFEQLDEDVIDYEIFQRPWGFYKTTVMNKYFQSKIISINPGARLSLQSHNHREEHWIVAHGSGICQIGDSIIEIRCGSSMFIPKGCKHRLTNTDENESLIITEVQLGDYFGEDDIIRYEDIYGRV